MLADFGLSAIVDDEQIRLNEYLGTHGYMAPEIILRKEYSFEVDVWSAGVVMYECLMKHQPFFDLDNRQLATAFNNWDTQIDSILDLENIPLAFYHLVMQTLRIDDRPNSAHILTSLEKT